MPGSDTKPFEREWVFYFKDFTYVEIYEAFYFKDFTYVEIFETCDSHWKKDRERIRKEDRARDELHSLLKKEGLATFDSATLIDLIN